MTNPRTKRFAPVNTLVTRADSLAPRANNPVERIVQDPEGLNPSSKLAFPFSCLCGRLLPSQLPSLPIITTPHPQALPGPTPPIIQPRPFASPVSSNTRAIAKKSGYSARTWGTCSEMVPFRVSEMWFPIRLSKAELQARATLAVPAIAIVFCTIIPILRKMMRSSSLHPTQSHTDPQPLLPILPWGEGGDRSLCNSTNSTGLNSPNL